MPSGVLHSSTAVPVTHQAANAQFSADYTTIFAASYPGFAKWTVSTFTESNVHALTPQPENSSGPLIGYTGTGSLGISEGLGSNVYSYDLTGTGTLYHTVTGLPAAHSQRGVETVFDSTGTVHYRTQSFYAGGDIVIDNNNFASISTGTYFSIIQMFADRNGKIWLFGQADANTTTACFYCVNTTAYFEVASLPAGGGSGALHYSDADVDQFVFGWAGHLYAVDTTTHSITASNTSIILPSGLDFRAFKAVTFTATKMWVGFEAIELATLTQVKTYDSYDWGYAPAMTLYDPLQNALVIGTNGYTLTWLFLDVTDIDVPPEGGGSLRIRSWTFTLDGHDFFCLRLGDLETIVYDTSTEQWYSYTTAQLDKWRVSTGANWVSGSIFGPDYGSNVLVGDDDLGVLYFLDPTKADDDDPADPTGDTVPFERVVQGQITHSEQNFDPCFGVRLLGSLGDTQTADPSTVTLQISDNNGHTYSSCGSKTIDQGSYDFRAEWLSLGSIRAPGRLFKITDFGALIRIDGLERLNAPGGN